ncbi:MAG TPA: hypothetical protein VMS79_01570 [Methanomassiliicoccales archaeon]|nr:hypothetical protein [Methanomassiliicoccales archaeon]
MSGGKETVEGPGDGEAPSTDTENQLIEALGRAYVYVNDARATLDFNYRDSVLLVVLLALLVWMVAFVALLAITLPSVWLLILPTVIAVGCSMVSYFVLKRRHESHMRDLGGWSRSLYDALYWERLGKAPEGEGGSLALLLDATNEIPKWLAVKRRHPFQDHPYVVSAIVLLAIAGLDLLASIGQMVDPAFKAASVIAALVLLGLGVFLFLRIWWKAAAESRRRMNDWNTRIAQAKARAEDIIGKL